MSKQSWSKRILLASVTLVAGALVASFFLRDQGLTRAKRVPEHPPLFGDPPACGTDARLVHRAVRAEQQGHLYAERYPYDPRDGIEAVVRFQEAMTCYQRQGLSTESARVERLASALIARINVDYASARLGLDRALGSESWRAAHTEIRQLLRLTEHLQGHDYVEHLSSLVGKVAAHADGDQ